MGASVLNSEPNTRARTVIHLFVAALFVCLPLAASQSGPFGFRSRRPHAKHHGDSTKLSNLLLHKRYLQLETALRTPARIPVLELALVKGVFANRENHIAESVRLLKPLFRGTPDNFTPVEERLGLRTLADDYAKSFQYGEAARTLNDLLTRGMPVLSPSRRDDIDGVRRLFEFLRHAPPETVKIARSFTIATQQNSAGMIEAPVSVAGHTQPWILDSGANISLLVLSRARALGLRLSTETTPVSVFFGKPAPGRMAVISKLRIGEAEVSNVVVLVIPDKDYYIAPIHLQLEAFLGYPVLSALGSVTFHRDGRFRVSRAPTAQKGGGSEMFMERFTPLVAADDDGTKRLFMLDTGASNTFLTARYLSAHRAEFAHEKPSTVEQPGGRKLPAYWAPKVTLVLGGVPITLHDVPVLTKTQGSGADYFYGNLGQDVLRQFRSYTLDFRSMRFTAEL